MQDKAMYGGFDPARQADYEEELIETHGDDMRSRIRQARDGMASWSQADFDALQADAEAIETGMAKALAGGLPADSAAVAVLMRRHHGWIEKHWSRPASSAAFTGLGRMYVDDPRFRERYDARQAGLAEYMAAAMAAYARNALD